MRNPFIEDVFLGHSVIVVIYSDPRPDGRFIIEKLH